MIENYCRIYRLQQKATLREVEGNDNVKALSAFEMGRSSNIAHFLKYVEYSKQHGDFDNFIAGLVKHLGESK